MPDLALHFPEPALQSIVNKYRWAAKYSAGLDLDDLAQVARESVETSKPIFDPERGGKSFIGFAWMRAAQAVHKHANEHRSAVRVPCDAAHGRGKRVVAYTNSITVPDNASGDADCDLLSWFGIVDDPDVDSAVDVHRTVERVRACVDEVRRAHAARGFVLNAVCLDGRAHADVAAELGVTRQAVTQTLTYALVDFKRAWLAAGWGAP